MTSRALAYTVFQTSRPSQLLLIVGVYLFGATIAVAHGSTASLPALLLGLVPLLLLSSSVHYANEFADHETDRLTHRTPFSGGSGALQKTGLPRTVPLYAGMVTALLGGLSTAVLALAGWLSTPAVGVLVLATVIGWQYSLAPLKLAWRGWGEVTNAALGGLALPVYGAAVLDGPLARVTLASVPFFLLVWLNLFATQWPDREADAAVGKRTLAVRWSRRRLRTAYVVLLMSAVLSLFVLSSLVVEPAVLPTAVVVASLPVIPLLVWGAWGYTKRHVPWPTVTGMVALLLCQFGGWLWLLWS